jgi:hypothetical protein
MADVKKVEKTAETGGVRNVSQEDADRAHQAQARLGEGQDELTPASPEYITPDTAIPQAAATVPGSEAAAEEAFPSDEAVAKLQKIAPTGKSFTQVRAERELMEKKGIPTHPNGVYGNQNNAKGLTAEPSGKTRKEMDAGAKALSEPGGYKDAPISSADLAGRAADEEERNRRADEQIDRVTGGVELKDGKDGRTSKRAAERERA